MPVPGANAVIDISHHQHVTVTGAKKIAEAGVIAVIHKASEGRDYRDSTYHERRKLFKSLGFLWGSYHFSSSARPILQVENYLNYAEPEADELVCLDYEPSSSGQNMSYGQMVEFIELVYREIGRWPVIYGGHLLREVLSNVGQSPVSNCPLWYARYSNTPIGIPPQWQRWALWQYSDGNNGQDPKLIPGFGRPDRDTFNGTLDELKKNWPLS